MYDLFGGKSESWSQTRFVEEKALYPLILRKAIITLIAKDI